VLALTQAHFGTQLRTAPRHRTSNGFGRFRSRMLGRVRHFGAQPGPTAGLPGSDCQITLIIQEIMYGDTRLSGREHGVNEKATCWSNLDLRLRFDVMGGLKLDLARPSILCNRNFLALDSLIAHKAPDAQRA